MTYMKPVEVVRVQGFKMINEKPTYPAKYMTPLENYYTDEQLQDILAQFMDKIINDFNVDQINNHSDITDYVKSFISIQTKLQ